MHTAHTARDLNLRTLLPNMHGLDQTKRCRSRQTTYHSSTNRPINIAPYTTSRTPIPCQLSLPNSPNTSHSREIALESAKDEENEYSQTDRDVQPDIRSLRCEVRNQGYETANEIRKADSQCGDV
jgi:hypothetical protein